MRRRANLWSWLLGPARPELANAPGRERLFGGGADEGTRTQTPGAASFLRDLSRKATLRSPTPLPADDRFTGRLSLAERGRLHLHELVLRAHRR
jgi:hypothetical protein